MNNRPIKFRAWDKATSRMYPEFHLLGETTCFDLLTQWLMEFPNGKASLERMGDVEVMQFTGLKDSAGKEIYEGDIVEYELSGYKYRDFIFYEGASFMSGPLDKSAANPIYGVNSICAVIGNILGNPNLLT